MAVSNNTSCKEYIDNPIFFKYALNFTKRSYKHYDYKVTNSTDKYSNITVILIWNTVNLATLHTVVCQHIREDVSVNITNNIHQ